MKSKVEAHIQAKAQLQAQIHRPGPGPGPRSKNQCQDFLTYFLNTFSYDFCSLGEPHDTPPTPAPSGGRVGKPPPLGFAPKLKLGPAELNCISNKIEGEQKENCFKQPQRSRPRSRDQGLALVPDPKSRARISLLIF